MTTTTNVLLWVDLEMTGLDPESCAILQAAYVLTDAALNELTPPREITIWQPDSVLETMTPFVRAMHEKSGLLPQVRASQTSVAEAEREILEVVSRHAAFRTVRLAGNSVWQDRRFMTKYMPVLEGYLHYRQVDVSTLKELAGWWYNAKFDKPDNGKHTALFDIRQSIAELRFYRESIFKH